MITTKDETRKRIAFVIETIAHLNSNPAIRPHVHDLLTAAAIVRTATDQQVTDAICRVSS